MRGEIVVVRVFGGAGLVRRVWDVSESVVYLTDDEQLQRYALGLPMLIPIGFPREDVFKFSAGTAVGGTVDWNRLERSEPGA